MTAALLDHLWQSSLVAAFLGALTLLFRRNAAGVRFWLWFAASLKFLLPFAALAALGGLLAHLAPQMPQPILALPQPALHLAQPVRMIAALPTQPVLAWLLAALWAAGFLAVLASRLLRWSRLAALVADARDLTLDAPLTIKTSPALLEPGLVGILKPVVLLPAELPRLLSRREIDSILAHEAAHLARRDNLSAALHMLVEALFWFWPPVWLIGARLIAERERACDESVLAAGHDAGVYAEGILKVCRFCIRSPLACAAGASGANLSRRIADIMQDEPARPLRLPGKLLLGFAALLLLALPVAGGFLASPLAGVVRQQVAQVQARYEAVVQQIAAAPAVRVEVKELPRVKLVARPVLLAALPAAVPPPPVADPAPPVAEAAPAAAPHIEPAPAATPSAARQAILILDPQGQGEPDAVTCRAPQVLPGSRLPGPQVCKPNREWAQLRLSRQQVSADGLRVEDRDVGDHTRNPAATTCPALLGGNGVINTTGQASVLCF